MAGQVFGQTLVKMISDYHTSKIERRWTSGKRIAQLSFTAFEKQLQSSGLTPKTCLTMNKF